MSIREHNVVKSRNWLKVLIDGKRIQFRDPIWFHFCERSKNMIATG